MNGLLFVPQTTLDGWLEKGGADVTADGLHFGTEEPIALGPAFRFLSLVEGQDEAGLLGKVKAERVLRDLGAEPCGDSLLLGEVVYEVEPGFLAVLPLAGGIGRGMAGVAQVDPVPTGAQHAAGGEAWQPGRSSLSGQPEKQK